MLTKNDLVLIGTMLLENRTSREIRQTFKIGNGCLTRFRKALNDSGLTPESLEEISEEELLSIVYGSRKSEEALRPLPSFDELYRLLNDKRMHYSLKIAWLHYKSVYPDGYLYSQFCAHYRSWEKKTHPGASATAPVRRNPGEFMYIDWVGDTPAIIRNPANPEKRLKAHFFVTTLGQSSKTFAVTMPDEKTERVLEGMNRAIAFYGALPHFFRPDNMKTAVTSNTPDNLVLSTAMEDLQDYYDTPVLPARPLSPKDKATVERAVEILEKEFIAPVSQTVFEDFNSLNQSLNVFLDQLNSRLKKPEYKSRNELFETIDCPAMRDLTQEPFQIRTVVRRKVGNNCHVAYEKFYYSVPYQLVGRDVILKISDRDIIICDSHNQEVARHDRAQDPSNRYTTVPVHLPSQHMTFAEMSMRNSEDYLKAAGKIGPDVRQLVKRILERSKYPEQEYRTASGIIHYCKGKHSALVNQAAEACLIRGKISLSQFKETCSALQKGSEDSAMNGVLPEHTNISGRGYYS